MFNLWLLAELVRPPPPPLVPRPREPTLLRGFTLDELRSYNGATLKDPIYMAISGSIYDVSRGRTFYGPGAQTQRRGDAPSVLPCVFARVSLAPC